MNLSDKNKLIDHMLSELETPYKVLTKWETDFIESIRDQWSHTRSLSNKQFDILERIYTEKTA